MTEHHASQSHQDDSIRALLAQIDAEYQSAQNGLTGLALGTAQHEFITARMEGIEKAREQLGDIVGPDKATELVVRQLTESAAKEDKPDA